MGFTYSSRESFGEVSFSVNVDDRNTLHRVESRLKREILLEEREEGETDVFGSHVEDEKNGEKHDPEEH